MKLALVFPGQGAQTIGMGRDLADHYPQSRQVFEEVDAALGEDLSALIWEGSMKQLTLTANAQPALMATSMAVLRALQAEGFDLDAATFVAGHSLGEYSALCASGSLSLADTARLLRIRGRAMQEATPEGTGRMAALLGLDIDAVADIAVEASARGICEVANDNDPRQVVVSGEVPAVEHAAELAKSRGARRAIMLPVSAPFHCSMMAPAERKMRAALEDADIAGARIPLLANVLAAPVKDPTNIREALVRQITGTVRWRESILAMERTGISCIWELGAGAALCGMARRTASSISSHAVGNPEQVRAVLEQFEGMQ